MSDRTLKILCRVFPTLSDEDLTTLADVAESQTYPAGVVLCQEGAFEDTFYVVVDGEVEVTKQLTEDANLMLKVLEPGEFFGEIALVQEGARTASVTTRTPTTVLEIKREAFRSVLEKSAPLAVRIMLQVTHHLRDADIRTIAGLRAKTKELAEAYAELERQERLRSEFLTTVSHELRTPLAAAMGYLQFVSSGMVPPEQAAEFLKTVERNLKTVVHLVNNILFLQELDLITPEFKDINVQEIVMQAVQEKLEQASRAGLTIATRIETGIPKVMGDAASLTRAVSALLDNAIKFSPDGGEIGVQVSARGRTLHIAVRDPGVGFPMERLDELFKPFTRIEATDEHMFGGVGLGLPIAKHVIEMHKGHIEAESIAGRGSTFIVVLPASTA